MKAYINKALCAAMALGAASYAVDTPASAPAAPQTPYFDMNRVSVSYAWMTGLSDGLTVDNLMGGTLSLGQSFGETEQYYHTWYAQTGYLYGRDSFVTSYQYTNGDKSGYRFEQSIVPITLGYTFHYKCSDQLSAYVGAQAGAYYSKTKKTSGDIAKDKWISIKKDSHTKFAPTLGVEVGAAYKISKRLTWDLGVNFNTTFSLYKEHECVGYSDVIKKDVVTATLHTGIVFTF